MTYEDFIQQPEFMQMEAEAVPIAGNVPKWMIYEVLSVQWSIPCVMMLIMNFCFKILTSEG